MAHNFRLTGNVYLSKAGSDTNDGLTKDSPKATLNAALALITTTNQTLVIGTGVYEETISKAFPTGTVIRADGNVKIRGNGSNTFVSTNSNIVSYFDIIFENYATLTIGVTSQVVRCVFLNNPVMTGIMPGFNNCIFINTNCTGQVLVTYCIFINCSVRLSSAVNSYFNSASTYRIAGGGGVSHNYNNVMGAIVNGAGASYASLAAYMADTTTNNSTFHINSFNLPPKFNNVYKYDFTLQDGSPHILAASDGVSNIGGTSYAKVSDMFVNLEWQIANGAVFSKNNGVDIAANAAEADIVYDGQDLVLATGKTKGYVIPAPVKIASNPQVLQGVNLNGIGYFNKSAANGTLMNDNVPDADAYPAATPAGTAGQSPDRLSYGLRFTDSDTQPGSDVDWINGYNGPAGAFVLLEPLGKPLMNSNGIGSGSALFDPASGVELSVIWVQPKITLTRLYA